VISDGFGKRPGDPQPGELAGPPVVYRLVLVDALVPDVGRDQLHLPSPVRLDGCPIGVADPDQVQQATS